jgi:hypothetical protein
MHMVRRNGRPKLATPRWAQHVTPAGITSHRGNWIVYPHDGLIDGHFPMRKRDTVSRNQQQQLLLLGVSGVREKEN